MSPESARAGPRAKSAFVLLLGERRASVGQLVSIGQLVNACPPQTSLRRARSDNGTLTLCTLRSFGLRPGGGSGSENGVGEPKISSSHRGAAALPAGESAPARPLYAAGSP